MKRRILGLFFLIALTALPLPRLAGAIPSSPLLHAVSQSDGTVLIVRQWGDERISGFETEDGYTIILDEALKTWYYGEKSTDGTLMKSTLRAGIDFPPSDLPKHLRPDQTTITEQTLRTPANSAHTVKKVAKTVADVAAAAVVSGTRYIPVILATFSDKRFTYTANDFNNLLFGAGNYSMKDYYREVSYGNLTIAPGSSGIAGPATVLSSHDYYGRDSGNDKDLSVADFVYEAVRAADGEVNFAEYSMNGSCTVDNVVIVHQGTGQEASAVSSDIWSHHWQLSSAKYFGEMNAAYPGAYTTNDPCPSGGYMKVDNYTIQPEINSDGGMITVGVFAHEYGHVLGLPDLYDTQRLDPINSGGAGDWSLMASGSYGEYFRTGDRPSHLDAWSKYKLGWVTPTLVTAEPTIENISAASTSADMYQLLSGTPDSGEYFLVENRQQSGFDAGLPGSGLLIWHIDGSIISAQIKNNAVNNFQCYPPSNCTTKHYGVALVQADGTWMLEQNRSRGDSGDPFPGSSNKTGFSSSTTPHSNLWSGVASNVSITAISASGQSMTATMVVTACSYSLPISSSISQSASSAGSFQLVTGNGCTWSAVSNAAWISITSGSSGSGSGTISFSVAANSSNSSRQGAINAGGKTYTITQTAAATGSGASSVLLNGDFELGQVNWIEYSSGDYSIVDNQSLNHSGLWSANLGGYNSAYESIRQTITIPAGVAQASLSFWYQISTREPFPVAKYDLLSMQLLDQNDSSIVVANLGVLSNLDADIAYKQSSAIDLNAYRGRTLQLAFVASTDIYYSTSFFIDDVVLTTSGTANYVTPSTTKAKVFLGARDDSFTVNNSRAAIYGNTGNDTITILAGVTGVILDQNIEQVDLSGLSGSFTFKQTGNIINVYDSQGTTLLANVPVQGDIDGTLLSFSNGMASALLTTDGIMKLGGETVSSNIAASVLNPTFTAGTAPSQTNSTKAKVFLGSDNDNFAVSNNGATLYGNTGTDVVTIAAGATGVSLDQNIERINFPGASSEYAFRQTGNMINIYDAAGATLLASTPLQDDADGTVIGFRNGTASALLSGGVMELGGATVNAVTPTTLDFTLH